jgi:plasmid stability protein
MPTVEKPVNPETAATILARVPVELKRELERRAREHDRSVSAELRVALREHLAATPRERAHA